MHAVQADLSRQQEYRDRYRISDRACHRHGQALIGMIHREPVPCPECCVDAWGDHAKCFAPPDEGSARSHYHVELVRWSHSGGWGLDWAWRVQE